MQRFEQVKKALIELYEEGAELEEEVSHALNTLEWVCNLTDSPSEYLKVAALGHDIDRVVKPRELQSQDESYDDFKKRHSERGSRLIAEFIKEYGYTEEEIHRISELVRLHEFGGSEEADILQDADSISYFDNNLEFFLKRGGYEKTLLKVNLMYGRCSPRAQRVINELPKYKEFKKLNHSSD